MIAPRDSLALELPERLLGIHQDGVARRLDHTLAPLRKRGPAGLKHLILSTTSVSKVHGRVVNDRTHSVGNRSWGIAYSGGQPSRECTASS